MARPLRIEFPGATYHLTVRGNAREPIFFDDADRAGMLRLLGETVERYRWLCHAYCLMGNHYHLLVETTDANLSDGMRQLNGIYTQRVNRRTGRVGHLFQGRFKAIVVDRNNYLLEVCRYIVLNPVRVGFVTAPEDYPWSSYQATGGLVEPPSWLTTDCLLSQFGSRRADARRRYRAYVHEGRDGEAPWADLRGQVLLGDREFVERLAPMLEASADAVEVPSAQRRACRPALAELLPAAVVADRTLRDRAVWEAHVTHGYSLAKIARHTELHYSTVSLAVRRRLVRTGA
jgi:putative transposase